MAKAPTGPGGRCPALLSSLLLGRRKQGFRDLKSGGKKSVQCIVPRPPSPARYARGFLSFSALRIPRASTKQLQFPIFFPRIRTLEPDCVPHNCPCLWTPIHYYYRYREIGKKWIKLAATDGCIWYWWILHSSNPEGQHNWNPDPDRRRCSLATQQTRYIDTIMIQARNRPRGGCNQLCQDTDGWMDASLGFQNPCSI